MADVPVNLRLTGEPVSEPLVRSTDTRRIGHGNYHDSVWTGKSCEHAQHRIEIRNVLHHAGAYDEVSVRQRRFFNRWELSLVEANVAQPPLVPFGLTVGDHVGCAIDANGVGHLLREIKREYAGAAAEIDDR